MKQILLTISYDGTNYGGWQAQANAVTVQEVLQNALSSVLNSPVKLTGASRTDAGVHAFDQKASFFIEDTVLKIPLKNLPLVINAALPSDITVTDARFAAMDFHPRYSAKQKIYRYTILNEKYPNPLLRNYAWHIHYELDTEKMKTAARFLVGEFDFSAFCASGASVKSFVRTVYETRIEKDGGLIAIYARGDGFLYNMVRIIAGTLMYAGCGKIAPDDIPGIILQKDRAKAGITAPPHGLTLYKVFY